MEKKDIIDKLINKKVFLEKLLCFVISINSAILLLLLVFLIKFKLHHLLIALIIFIISLIFLYTSFCLKKRIAKLKNTIRKLQR